MVTRQLEDGSPLMAEVLQELKDYMFDLRDQKII